MVLILRSDVVGSVRHVIALGVWCGKTINVFRLALKRNKKKLSN